MLPRRDRVACGSCHFSRRELGLRARRRFFALFVLLFSFAAQNERHRYSLFRSFRLTTYRRRRRLRIHGTDTMLFDSINFLLLIYECK